MRVVYISHDWDLNWSPGSGGCFTNVSRALQNNLAKIYNARNNIYADNFKLKLCTCAQSMAWAHVQSFSLKFSPEGLFLRYTHFERIFWRARETLVKQPPDTNVFGIISTRNFSFSIKMKWQTIRYCSTYCVRPRKNYERNDKDHHFNQNLKGCMYIGIFYVSFL